MKCITTGYRVAARYIKPQQLVSASRHIGADFMNEDDMRSIVRVRESFDGLIFVDTATAARPYRRPTSSK